MDQVSGRQTPSVPRKEAARKEIDSLEDRRKPFRREDGRDDPRFDEVVALGLGGLRTEEFGLVERDGDLSTLEGVSGSQVDSALTKQQRSLDQSLTREDDSPSYAAVRTLPHPMTTIRPSVSRICRSTSLWTCEEWTRMLLKPWFPRRDSGKLGLL